VPLLESEVELATLDDTASIVLDLRGSSSSIPPVCGRSSC